MVRTFGGKANTRVTKTDRRTSLRAGGIRQKLLIFLVFVVVLIALLPLIIAKMPLLNLALSTAISADVVQVSSTGASFGWFSGPTLSGVQVTDSAGNALLMSESISVSRAPINLVLNQHELGIIQIKRPQLFIKVRPDGSNLEDTLQKLLGDTTRSVSPQEPSPKTSKTSTAFALQLVEGTIFVEDAATGRVWRLDGVNGQYDCHGTGGGIGNGSLAGQLVVLNPGGTAPQPAGRFAITLKPNGNRNELALQAEGLALAASEPWLRRVSAGTELSGTLSGNGTAAWSANTTTITSDLTTTGNFAVDRLDAATSALAGDRIRLARVEIPWRVTSTSTGVSVDDLRLKSEAGQLAIHGRLGPNAVSPSAKPQALGSLSSDNSDVELRGAIDLARLAAMLPHALRIRGDTTINSGAIELTGRIQPTPAGQSLSGSLRTAQLAATTAGKAFRWDDPVSANFAIRRENGGYAVDALQCDSKFLRVHAAGTPQKLKANAQFDLNSLAEQLGQFIDLSGIQLAGTGTAQLVWQQTDGNKFTGSASGELAQLRVALSQDAIWTEPQLTLKADATGVLDPSSHKPIRVDSAALLVNGQSDVLDARLAGAVALSNTEVAWPITVRSTGSVARWLTRVRPWFTPGTWRVGGDGEIAANIRATGTSVDVTDSKIVLTNLSAANDAWNIREPRVEFAGDAHLNRATGQFATNSAQLVTSTVSVAAKDVRYAHGERGIGQLAGAAAFRADLARVAAWKNNGSAPSQYQPAGEFIGNIRFAQQAGHTTGEVTANGQNLVLMSTASRGVPAPSQPANYPPAFSPTTPQTIWQEPRLTLHGLANYDAATDRLNFDQFQIQSNSLQANAAGQIERFSTDAECNVNGALNYDLAQLSPLLRPYVGEGVQLNGREQAKFALAGRLSDTNNLAVQQVSYANQPATRNPQSAISWSRRVRAQFELPWSTANVYGLPVGPGKLAAKLGDGNVQVAPVAVTVGEGQINLAPTVRFDPEPAELTLPPGPVITNVRISPEVSEAMLKFFAPVMAGATQSEGLFSMQLDACRVPLADTKKADSVGKLTVHSVRVVPGPATEQWVGLARQIESLVKRRDPASLANRPPVTLLSIRDQQVNFRVVDGRVHHENIEFQVGDIIMRTQGSVGLDETLSITLQIPLQDAWITKEPLLANFKGQSLQVPVGGTLKRPQIDQRAVANLSAQLFQNAAGQAVGNEINKALDKFLKPKK
jgi:hypothetical protein